MMLNGFELVECKEHGSVEFKGVFDGIACAWRFELRKPDGTFGWSDCRFQDGMPEIDACDEEHFNWLGLVPTGRVLFRGYFEEYEEKYYGKWETFVCEVNVDDMVAAWSPKSVACTTSLADVLANIKLA